MKKSLMMFLSLAILLLPARVAGAREYEWSPVDADASRTACSTVTKDNVSVSLGTFKGGKYIAPSGRKYCKRSATAKVAREVIGVQERVSSVKEVVGFAPKPIDLKYPESPLSNMFIDVIMANVRKLSGKEVDFGVGNFGGIRRDGLNGEILLDDLLSMFPFKNQIVYVAHKGSTLRALIESMAADSFQVLGGVEVLVENGKVVKALIGGEPIDDDKIYGVATISFLLNGGDKLYLGKDALEIQIFDVDIIDIMLDYVKGLAAEGKPVLYSSDSRVIIR
ncbi:MAG: 5'-nucleotidase C-terminal domain-containing protein [Candidatus Cryptobacteroides sp.]